MHEHKKSRIGFQSPPATSSSWLFSSPALPLDPKPTYGASSSLYKSEIIQKPAEAFRETATSSFYSPQRRTEDLVSEIFSRIGKGRTASSLSSQSPVISYQNSQRETETTRNPAAFTSTFLSQEQRVDRDHAPLSFVTGSPFLGRNETTRINIDDLVTRALSRSKEAICSFERAEAHRVVSDFQRGVPEAQQHIEVASQSSLVKSQLLDVSYDAQGVVLEQPHVVRETPLSSHPDRDHLAPRIHQRPTGNYIGEVNTRGEYEGFGTLESTEGDQKTSYTGYFRGGLYHGDGMEKRELSVQEDEEEAEEISPEELRLERLPWVLYEGSYCNGCRDGFARITLRNETVFCGMVRRGIIEGLGSFKTKDGEETKGRWRNGVFIGRL